MASERVRGIGLLGDAPKRLELSDGSRLLLDGSVERGPVEWRRLGRRRPYLSVSEAKRLAGSEYQGYVDTRTKAEIEWLRAMADWYRDQAELLQRELSESRA
jgi:hypothetical protein